MSIERELLQDLELYAANQLKIKPKVGAMIPFVFNRAQKYLHQKLEEQKKRTGRVRAIILKGRQQGSSTYVAARYYHRTVTSPDMLTFIFAHDTEASQSLYSMVKRFYDESTDQNFRPRLGTSNAKELLFPGIRSGYKVGTAGTKGLGRSKTMQQVHWSEVAYSPNCEDHAAGILQTVADEGGTEIILESTANGEGDYFHRQCMQAISGEGDFELIFIPWYWQPEYTREAPKSFELSQPLDDQDFLSEQEYYDMFKGDGLTLEHLAWRRKKIVDDFQGDAQGFMREYPFTPEEAFEAAGVDAFVKPMLIRKARSTPPVQASQAPLVFGVDVAQLGGDAFKVCHRKGRNATKMDTYPKMRLDQSRKRLKNDIEKYKPVKVFIDVGGIGLGLYDELVGDGYGKVVEKVNFGGQSSDPERWYNMTAEMFYEALQWFNDSPCSMAQMDEVAAQAIQSQLSARQHEWLRNSVLKMETKQKFKERLGYSPDDGDAFLLTFAQPVAPVQFQGHIRETVVLQPEWNPF